MKSVTNERIHASLNRVSKKKQSNYDISDDTKRVNELELNESRHHRITAYQKDLLDWITAEGNGSYLYYWLSDALIGNVRKDPDDIKKINGFKTLIHQAKEKPKRGSPRINP